MNISRTMLFCLALAPLTSGIRSAQQAQDKEGCKDSTLISRFPGSIITDCKDAADDSFTFTLDKGKQQTVEGEFHMIEFKFPGTASKAQVVRNMNTAMRRAGYTMVYDSGDYGDFTGRMGKTWFQIEIGGDGGIRETIVKEIKLTQDVVADAAALSTSLTGSGHSVVNGILFDTGKAELKPESAAALQEVVKLLQQDPQLKLYVVGHTDNVGTLASNLDLSKRRAAAVVQALTTQYGVAATRVDPFGAGPYAPIASNETEDGRSSNRRVEIVKQ
jgi:OmpA-OmpF porin, OOP family